MTISYAFIQFLFWFAYGAAVNFSSVYLLGCGLTNTTIGLISSIACVLSVLIQPALASYADREHAVSINTLLLGMTGVLMGLGVLLSVFYQKGAMINGFLLGGAILIVQVALPFINALATEMMNGGVKINFSIARGFGSLGYAAMSFSIGRLAAIQGAGIIPWIIIGSSTVLLISLLLFRFKRQQKQHQEKASGSLSEMISKYPTFMAVLIGCVLIYTSHVFINNFVYQIVVYKGGTSENMGIVMSTAGLLEILTMFLFSKLLKWKDCTFWFRICGIFFTLKCVGTLMVGSMGALYAVQILQPLGWGLMTVSSVYYVNKLMMPQDKIKGQAYMTMTLSVGTIIGSLLGGWLIDTIGVAGMLIVSIFCGAVGTAIVIAKTSDSKKKSPGKHGYLREYGH